MVEDPSRSGRRLATLLAHWRLWQESQHLSERTIAERAAVIRHLVEFTGENPLKLSADGIVEYLARPKLSSTTKSTYHATIRAWSRWLVLSGRRKDDPTTGTPRPKRPRSMPRPVLDEQLIAILAVVNRRRTRMMVMLAAMAGLRVHEIAKIRGEDFDLARGTLVVTGKGAKTAIIALQGDLWEIAHEWPRYGYWFPGYGGDPHITGKAVSSAIGNAMRRAGIDGTPHQLRHWYGTSLLKAGVDLRKVQELMRHESPATTAIYTKVDIDAQIEAIKLLQLPSTRPNLRLVPRPGAVGARA